MTDTVISIRPVARERFRACLHRSQERAEAWKAACGYGPEAAAEFALSVACAVDLIRRASGDPEAPGFDFISEMLMMMEEWYEEGEPEVKE